MDILLPSAKDEGLDGVLCPIEPSVLPLLRAYGDPDLKKKKDD
jgi:hypothetical protein